MIKKIKLSTYLFLGAFTILSCNSSAQKTGNQNSTINSVSYRHTVGRAGYLNIIATKDSLISEKRGTAFKEIPMVRKKMNTEDWKKILAAVNVETLEKTSSGEGRGHYDGPDEFYEIKTSDKTFSLVNVQDSAKARQLQNLKVLLKKLTVAK